MNIDLAIIYYILLIFNKIIIRSIQKLNLLHDILQKEHDKLKQDDSDKNDRLKTLTLQVDRREQAKSDLNGLEETVVSKTTYYNNK